MQNIISLSKQIKERMKLHKLTQLDLAEHTGLSLQTIGAIVRGNEGTAIKNWITVTNALGFDIELKTKKVNYETSNNI